MRVALQPVGSGAGKQHYEDTILRPVEFSDHELILDPAVFRYLMARFPQGSAPVWGVTPGRTGKNKTQWDKLEPGDLALFLMDGKVVYSGEIAFMFENEVFAEDLWQRDEHGQTWQHIYMLDNGQGQDIPREELLEAIGGNPKDNIQGFRVLDHSQSTAAVVALEELVQVEPVPDSRDPSDEEEPLPQPPPETKTQEVEVRVEQPKLRKHHLPGAEGTCVFCGRTMMKELLWTAHFKKRAECSPEEKNDWDNVAGPACKLGCDELYERGMIWVDEGGAIQLAPRIRELADDDPVRIYAEEHLDGQGCTAFSEASSHYFSWHREKTAKKV